MGFVGAKEGYKFQFPLSTDLLVKRHDMARCPPGKSKVCQKSAGQNWPKIIV